MRKISFILVFYAINIWYCSLQAQVPGVSRDNLKNYEASVSSPKELKDSIQWEPTERLLPDTAQNKLFQKLTPLDFENNIFSVKKSDSLGHIKIWVPDQSGFLLIKEPENANNGFLLILDPD
ncbi:MAG: hypothetical protein K0B37_02620 [Bacteroidales bacterium]|nr:hypothetical protein [Bacteroidales bacterium]